MNYAGKTVLLLFAIAGGLWAGAGSRNSSVSLSASPNPQASDSKSLLCLMYHRFVDDAVFQSLPPDLQAYAITPGRFESQLHMLKECGYESVSLDDAVAFAKSGRPLPRRAVLITIDDGFESAIKLAAPILKKHAAKATLFVTTDPTAYVFECEAACCDDPRMGRRQLRVWCDLGLDIGSHGVTHRPLNLLSDRELTAELTKSREKLERLTGRKVTTLAAPRGRWDERVQQFARAAGYEAMFTSDRGDIAAGTDAFALARRNVSGRWSKSKFRSLIESGTRGVKARPNRPKARKG